MKLRELAESKRDILMIDPRIIVVEEGYNVRDLSTADAQAKLMELARSIANTGFSSEHPVIVRLDEGKAVLVAGHRRRAATMIAIDELGAEIRAIPCIPEARGTSEADRTADLITSNSGEPLTALETAAVLKRLAGFGWDSKRIAARYGWASTQTVDNYLDLLSAPEAVQEMVRKGEVSASTAIGVTRKEGSGATETLERAKRHAAATGKTRVTASVVSSSKGDFVPTAANAKILIAGLVQIAADNEDDDHAKIAADTLERVGALRASASSAAE